MAEGEPSTAAVAMTSFYSREGWGHMRPSLTPVARASEVTSDATHVGAVVQVGVGGG
jgi:hypothetical protein